MRADATMEIRVAGYKPFQAIFYLTGTRRNSQGIPIATGKIRPQEAARSGILKEKIMEFVDIFCASVARGENKE